MTALDMRPADLPEVLLIDLSSLFWAAWHSSGEDEISAARRRTLDGVARCIGDEHGRLVAICCDSGRSFRKDMYPDYKAQRPEKDHASIAELARVKQKLRDDGFRLWEAPGFEADDVIATATAIAVERGHAVMVASADKDLLQLCWEPGPVRALRTHNWTVMGEADVQQKYGVPPEQLGDWLALVGDASDNIRGAPGVGAKTATELLNRFGTIGEIWKAIDAGGTPVSKPSVARSLEQNREAVNLARKLVALRTDAPIEFAEIYESPKPKRITPEVGDMDTPDPEYVDVEATPGAGPPPVSTRRAPVAPPPAPAAAAAPAPPDVPAPAAPAPAPAGAPDAASDLMVMQAPPANATTTAYELALEPTSLGVAFKLGKALWESRLYTRFPGPEAITAVIIRGREMGIGALTALDLFHIIDGKPSPHAHFIISLGEAHPDCEYFQQIHSDNTYAEYETKNRRHKQAIRHKYTIQDAVDAGLCGLEVIPRTARPGDKDHRGQWDKRRAEMLRKTAAVQLVRIAYPKAALGLYSVEELGGES